MTPLSADTRDRAHGDVEDFIREGIEDAAAFWSHNGGREAVLELGRVRIRLRMAGRSVPDLILPALQHAVASNEERGPDAVVYAIDSAASGFPAPPEEWTFLLDTPEANLRTHWCAGRGPVLSSDESRGIWHLYDMQSRQGLYWLRSCADLPAWEAGSPLRHHVHWISHAAGQGMLHAAVVSNGFGGAMLTGPGGSGKSTMTAAALRQGWQVTGDDFVLVGMDPRPESYRLYDLIKLTGMAESLFSEHAGNALNPGRKAGEKLLARISAMDDGAFVARLPITAVLSLRLTGGETSEIIPASRLDVIRAIAPSTSMILRTGLPETFAYASALLRDLPCHTFNVGRDPLEALDVLGRFLEATDR